MFYKQLSLFVICLQFYLYLSLIISTSPWSQFKHFLWSAIQLLPLRLHWKIIRDFANITSVQIIIEGCYKCGVLWTETPTCYFVSRISPIVTIQFRKFGYLQFKHRLRAMFPPLLAFDARSGIRISILQAFCSSPGRYEQSNGCIRMKFTTMQLSPITLSHMGLNHNFKNILTV